MTFQKHHSKHKTCNTSLRCACWQRRARPSPTPSRPLRRRAAGLRSASSPAWRPSAGASASIYLRGGGEVRGQDRGHLMSDGGRGPSLTVDLQHRLHGAHGVGVGPLLHDGVGDGLQLEDNAKHFLFTSSSTDGSKRVRGEFLRFRRCLPFKPSAVIQRQTW